MPLPERIDSVKHIKTYFANSIYDVCGCDSVNEVCDVLGRCESEKELGELVGRCCPNARGGQVDTRTGYTVPRVNSNAAVALLALLMERPDHLRHVPPARVRAMINKIQERRS